MNYRFQIPDADNLFRTRCEKTACLLYGEPLPDAVEDRLEQELDVIDAGGFSTHYEVAARIADEVRRLGYHINTRGMLGSSFAAWLCGISAVNPLPAHFLCGECCHFELADSEKAWRIHGYDLADRQCPVCGKMMHPNGADILPEILMGKHFDREPDIYLNVAPDIRKDISTYLKGQFSDAVLLRAGISREGKNDKQLNSIHPGGLYIVPKEPDLSKVTGLREPDDDDEFGLPVTVRDFSELYGVFTRWDVYTLPSLGLLNDMEEATGVIAADIPMNDNAVLDVFYEEGFETFLPPGAFPAYGKREIEIAQPACFSEIVQVSGMLHGTGTWDEDTESLLCEGKRPNELIAYRDDILRTLLEMGADQDTAFRIMDRIRKGRGLTETDEKTMDCLGIPFWFADRCKKIAYVFPKSHGVESATLDWKLAWYRQHYPNIYYERSARYRH